MGMEGKQAGQDQMKAGSGQNGPGWKDMTYRAGRDVSGLVDSAIKNGDYSALSEQINWAMNRAVDAVHDSLLERGMQSGTRPQGKRTSEKTAYEQAVEEAGKSSRRAADEGRSRLRIRNNFAATAGKVIGTAGMIPNLLLAIGCFTVAHSAGVGLFFLAITGMFYWLRDLSVKRLEVIDDAETILRIRKGRDVISVEEIASALGKSKKDTRKSLKEILRKGILNGPVYMDRGETTLILSREAYGLYSQTMESYRNRKREEEKQRTKESRRKEPGKRAEETSKDRADAPELGGESLPEYGKLQAQKKAQQEHRRKLDAETQKILDEGQAFIAHIHLKNEEIPGEEISAKLDRLEQIVTGIFDQVEKSPESAPDLHRLMSYYLPTTQKLIDTYATLDAQHLEGENIESAKREIESSLDTINDAYEKLFDSFFQHTAWDVGTDVSVMKSMLRQDGLTEDEFQQMRQAQAESEAKQLKQTQVSVQSSGQWTGAGLQAAEAGEMAKMAQGQVESGKKEEA
ncbi:MAG: 5-bromo-4-chloroindolyl phosphate hydrolysis family protein [Porcincola intestinalis]|uniref:5-bromo-4-chloroindolyl phosphate hydrolysis family protein n=1 Tax=Porcincola intestinalis TaxID=2606632 RepID=UPI002A916CF8|nr:5-bromo-4-chloroindolyl phosphate hydrolysis family protein [Porcincola intestinalis]MDY5332662.1 5-bromo-4-chloroindolyl phosphate hydrolysis family protein [Porcincola intestinalis]